MQLLIAFWKLDSNTPSYFQNMNNFAFNCLNEEERKYGGGKLAEKMRVLFERVISHEKISNGWREGFTIPILKKTERTILKTIEG